MGALTTVAIAGTVLQGAGMVSGWKAKKKAQKSAKRIRRRTLPLLDMQYSENLRQMQLQEDATLGAQNVGYAAGGAEVGRGTARVVAQETTDEFARARRLAGLSHSAERTAAVEGASLGGPNYASGLASLASSIGESYKTYKVGQADKTPVT